MIIGVTPPPHQPPLSVRNLYKKNFFVSTLSLLTFVLKMVLYGLPSPQTIYIKNYVLILEFPCTYYVYERDAPLLRLICMRISP